MIKSANQNVLALGLLILTLAMATQVFLHFAPGALSPDSLSILAQARSGIFEDGQPPLMAAIWRGLDRIAPGPVGMLLLNLILFYGGLYLIFLWGAPRNFPGILPAALVVGAFPPIIGILGVIWIDVTMAGFFLAAVGINLIGYAHPAKGVRIGAFLFALFFASLGMVMRHNGAAAAFPLISLFLLQFVSVRTKSLIWPALALLGGLLITLVLFLGARQISAQYVDVPRHLWRVGAIYDIAGTSYQEREYLFQNGILKQSTQNDVYKLYTPRSFTPLVLGEQIHRLPGQPFAKGNPFELNLSDPALDQRLRRNWADVIILHPAAYLKHRYDVFSSLVTRSPWGLWVPVFDVIYPNDLGIAQRPVMDSRYFTYIKQLAQASIIFVPLLYLILSALMVIPTLVLGLRFQNRVLLVASALYGSGLTHMVGLFFLAASADFRYSHWLITATVMATSLVVLELVDTAKKTWVRVSDIGAKPSLLP